ncbi:MAG: topoisomerase IV subunit B [Rhodocyclaceae bacterium]|nr:MAG: topoisomerase IV subunit B [Rhodocyclaceae bacterium]
MVLLNIYADSISVRRRQLPPTPIVDHRAGGALGSGYPEAKRRAGHSEVDDFLMREQTLVKLRDEGVSENKITVSRFKGLGEMNPDQLWETTLCPDTRRLVPFQADRETIKQMTATFTLLMGKGEAAGRRAWMEKDGGLVEADV